MPDGTTTGGGSSTPLANYANYRQNMSVQSGIVRKTQTISGKWNDLKPFYERLSIGLPAQESEGSSPPTVTGENFELRDCVAAASITRREGGLADCTLTTIADSRNRPVAYVNVDTMQVAKSIYTWHAPNADEESNSNGEQGDNPSHYEDGTVNENKHPDLSKIKRWETLETTDPEAYVRYEIYNINNGEYEKLHGRTLTLAQMLRKGIQSYTVHTYVLNLTVCTAKYPDFVKTKFNSDTIDQWMTKDNLKSLFSSTFIGAGVEGEDTIADISSQYEKWLFNNLRVTCNADGSWTTLISFIGLDDLEERLYEPLVKSSNNA